MPETKTETKTESVAEPSWELLPPKDAEVRFDLSFELEPSDMMAMLSQMQTRQLKPWQIVLNLLVAPLSWLLFKYAGENMFPDGPLHFWLSDMPQFLCIFLFSIVLFYLLARGLQRVAVTRQFNNDPGTLRRKQMSVRILDDDVLSHASDSYTRYTWRSFFRISRDEQHTFFWIQRNLALIVPDRAFDSKDDAMQMFLFAQDRHRQVTETSQSET